MKSFIYKSMHLFFALLFVSSIALQAQDPIILRVTSPSGIDWDIDGIKTANDHGPQITENVSGELAAAYDGITAPTDNDTWTEFGAYCCAPIANPEDIDGKIAYISRGACSFSQKILNAQNAGAIAVIIANRAPIGLVTGTHDPGLIIMAGTQPQSDSITIPAIFISHEDRLELEQMMAEGPVQATFEAEVMYDATGPLAYSTPLDQVTPLDLAVVAYTRMGDTLYNVNFNVDITDPSGGNTTFTETLDTLLPGKDWIAGTVHDPLIEFEDEYIPSEVGTYTITYSASTQGGNHPLDSKTITTNFEITENTWALDNGLIEDINGMQFNDASYADNGYNSGTGSYFYAGADGVATHASFAIANPGALNIGLGFDMFVKLYQVPSVDGVPLAGSTGTELASELFQVEGTEVPNEFIYTEFSTPVTLEKDSIYLLMVEANGAIFSLGIPAYTSAGGFVTPNKSTAYVWGDTYNSSGFEYWNGGSDTYPHGGRRPMVRLYTEGFTPPVSVKELLPEDQLSVFPTLGSELVNVAFDLDQPSKEVYIIVTSATGRTMYAETHDNIQTNTITLDVDKYAAGNYFVTVRTDKGVRTKKFMVVR